VTEVSKLFIVCSSSGSPRQTKVSGGETPPRCRPSSIVRCYCVSLPRYRPHAVPCCRNFRCVCVCVCVCVTCAQQISIVWAKKGSCVAVNKHHAMKTYGGVEENLHAFLTSPLDGEWLAPNSGRFDSRERSIGNHSIQISLCGPHSRSGRCGEEKCPAPPETEPRPSSL
jgi:hypothetical protein